MTEKSVCPGKHMGTLAGLHFSAVELAGHTTNEFCDALAEVLKDRKLVEELDPEFLKFAQRMTGNYSEEDREKLRIFEAIGNHELFIKKEEGEK